MEKDLADANTYQKAKNRLLQILQQPVFYPFSSMYFFAISTARALISSRSPSLICAPATV